MAAFSIELKPMLGSETSFTIIASPFLILFSLACFRGSLVSATDPTMIGLFLTFATLAITSGFSVSSKFVRLLLPWRLIFSFRKLAGL